jgi:hypothetical protein
VTPEAPARSKTPQGVVSSCVESHLSEGLQRLLVGKEAAPLALPGPEFRQIQVRNGIDD